MRNLLWVLVLFSTSAFAGGITDRAGLFSQQASSQALGIIKAISDTHQQDITVDVYNEAPSTQYAQWAIDHAPDVSGLYVVISRTPGHLEVVTKNSSKYSTSDREHISQLLIAGFKARNFDRGLLDALNFASTTLGGAVAMAAPIAAAPVALAQTAAVPEAQAASGVVEGEDGEGWSIFWWFLVMSALVYGAYRYFKAQGVRERANTDLFSGTTTGRVSSRTPNYSNGPRSYYSPRSSSRSSGGDIAVAAAAGAASAFLVNSAAEAFAEAEKEAKRRRRQQEESDRQREAEAQRQRDTDSTILTAAALDSAPSKASSSSSKSSSSSSYDSGSSGSSYSSSSSGSSWDSGSSGGGFDSGGGGGSSGGDF